MNLFPLAPSFIAAIAGAIAVYIAFQQWRTAKDKLSIDLFDRRLAAYTEINNSINERQEEILRIKSLPEIDTQNDVALKAFRSTQRKIHFLFGQEVKEKIAELEKLLSNSLISRLSFLTLSPPVVNDEISALEFKKLYEDTLSSQRNVRAAQEELGRLVGPYMMLGRISVNRPA